MAEIFWCYRDESGEEIPALVLDLGPPPSVGDTINLWFDGDPIEGLKQFSGVVMAVNHDIRILTRGNPKAVRYAEMKVKVNP